jgi:hypothetical protein
LIDEVENFKQSTLTSLIEQAVNSNFEAIINKHNSGGKLHDLDQELHSKAEGIIKEKLKA